MRTAFALMLCVAACGGDDSHTLPDAARVDARPDATVDAAPDGPPPHLTLLDSDGNPVTQLTFADTFVNSATVQSFTLKNDGGEPTPALALAATAPFSIDATTTCSGPLAGGASCIAAIAFSPLTVGDATGSVDVTAGDLHGSVAASGTAVTSLLPQTPSGSGISSLSFTMIAVGSTNGFTFVVKNLGTVPTPALVTAITGAGFSLDAPTTTCTGAVVAVGGMCDVHVVFTPLAPGMVSGDVTITAGADVADIGLSGDAMPAP